jgi:hypothetical protein
VYGRDARAMCFGNTFQASKIALMGIYGAMQTINVAMMVIIALMIIIHGARMVFFAAKITIIAACVPIFAALNMIIAAKLVIIAPKRIIIAARMVIIAAKPVIIGSMMPCKMGEGVCDASDRIRTARKAGVFERRQPALTLAKPDTHRPFHCHSPVFELHRVMHRCSMPESCLIGWVLERKIMTVSSCGGG